MSKVTPAERRIMNKESAGRRRVEALQEKEAMRIYNGKPNPIQEARMALGMRFQERADGTVILDGRVTSLKAVIIAANDVLKEAGKPPMKYPGVQS